MKKLCPLKFNFAQPFLIEATEDKQIIARDMWKCEKEKCVWWVDVKGKEWKESGYGIKEQDKKGCAIKLIATK